MDILCKSTKLGRRRSFYDELKGEWYMQSVDNLVICLGDFNGHIAWYIHNGFDGVCGGYCAVQRNLDGRMLLWFFL